MPTEAPDYARFCVRPLFLLGLCFFAAFIVGWGGAATRYYGVLYGAPPLVVALICLGAASYLYASRRRRAWIPGSIGCWLLAAGVAAIWNTPSLIDARLHEPRLERTHVLLTLPADRIRATLFEELQPVGLSNCELQRFGERNDGGYLLCGNLLGSIKTGYSYGIAGYDKWGCDVARRFDVTVHQYDCFDLQQPVCRDGRTIFHTDCIGPSPRTDEAGRVFDTLENQLAANGDAANRVLVKMDIEAAEWDTLLRAPDAVLQRIDQLAIELHAIGLEDQLAVVRRLKQFFHVAHLHYNNATCKEWIDPFPAWAYEMLFVNKRIAVAGGPAPARPHPLDTPSSPGLPDCQAPTSRWSVLKWR